MIPCDFRDNHKCIKHGTVRFLCPCSKFFKPETKAPETQRTASSALSGMLTGSQVFYVTQVYPEKITTEDADAFKIWKDLTLVDQNYWDTVAKVIAELAS